MNPRRFLRISILIILSLVIAGCASNVEVTPEEDKIEFPWGAYRDDAGHITTFMEDGTQTLEFKGRLLIENGRYSIEGNTITLYDSEICPPVDGVYQWTLKEGNLHLSLVEDDCFDRATSLNNAILNPIENQ